MLALVIVYGRFNVNMQNLFAWRICEQATRQFWEAILCLHEIAQTTTWGAVPRAAGDAGILMKTCKNLYEKFCSYENLLSAYKKARKGKSKKWYVRKFESNLEDELRKLQNELMKQTYGPSPMKRFVIQDPRTRLISASHFRDRVVHHALCNILEPIFDKTFIQDSYASRKGKGTHAALKRFDYFKRKVSCNGKLAENAGSKNMIKGYFLKADIKHYFDSIDHDVLIKIINRKIKDGKILWLVRRILDNQDCKIPMKGMPIGNLTSQFFANLYLNELDYFIKHKLRAKYYIRYLDDFVILHRNKNILIEWKSEINEFLKTIQLELHTQKSKIYPLHCGVNLLGFRIFYHYKLPYKRNLRKITAKLDEMILLHKERIVSKNDIMKSFDGWAAYAMWGNTYKMRTKLYKRLNKL